MTWVTYAIERGTRDVIDFFCWNKIKEEYKVFDG